ncbi:serine hydrolase domain-containing protein [Natranaerobius thermophilus]|uniref:Beta-lactamase n=1 Tax=Natranaerobius thermophilus (strain ATCC BAA-1301 / DSM 18059 / JW/NM-WN-LF) TaxID=457570 RepID=B2A7B9_NATTJ|nr:serine hydrolase domain-containing protein [Natranaerobius thermophilus]ACB84313.1 beta-lactamase [Natranaerobius thermophilus JW/NM-WN-LF]
MKNKLLPLTLAFALIISFIGYHEENISKALGFDVQWNQKAHEIKTKIVDQNKEVNYSVGGEQEMNAVLQKQLEDIVEEYELAGVQVAAVNEKGTIVSGNAGKHSLEDKTEIDDNTILRSASVSKAFTAVATMQLVEQQQIDLDADINDYLELEVDIKHPEYPDTNITPRMLLNHSSGMTNGTYVSFASNSINRGNRQKTPPSLSEVFDEEGEFYSNSIWSEYKPGEKFIYTNLGYIVLGAIVENVSGMNFDEYTNENIFNPLGMNSSSFNINDLRNSRRGRDRDRIAPLYRRTVEYIDQEESVESKKSTIKDNEKTLENKDQQHNRQRQVHFRGTNFGDLPEFSNYRPGRNGSLYSPQGGLFTTATDLAKFASAMINGGEYQGNRILEQETIELMKQVSVSSCAQDWTDFDGLFKKQGLGLHITDELLEDGITLYGHPGIAYGLLSGVYFTDHTEQTEQSRRENNFGIVYLINGANTEIPGSSDTFYEIEEEIAKTVYDSLYDSIKKAGEH